MNYLKRKICISMYLDEFFEDVDEGEESFGKEDVRRGYNAAKEINARTERPGQKKFIKNTPRPRKYKNAYILSHEEQIPCGEPREKLYIEEIELQQQQQRVKSMSSISQHDTRHCYKDSKNDYDVEEFYDSDLEESCTQANGDCRIGRKMSKEGLIQGMGKEKRTLNSVLVSMRSDIKLRQKVQRTVTEGSAQTEHTCETVEAISVQMAERTHRSLQTSRKLISETKIDAEMQVNDAIKPLCPYRSTKQKEVFDEKNGKASIGDYQENQNEDAARVTKCAVSIGLSREKNKFTQTDSGILLDSNYISKPSAIGFKSAGECRREKKRDGKLGLFDKVYPRKGKCMRRITNASSMSSIYKSRKCICPRVLSDTKFNYQREAAILWRNQKMENWMMCGAESRSPRYSETNILKKGYCDVTVKTSMKANKPRFVCYSLSIPWRITTFGEFVIPKNALRMNKMLLKQPKHVSNDHGIFTESSDSFESYIKSSASRERTELVNGKRLVDAGSSSVIRIGDVSRRLISEKNSSSRCKNAKMENENSTKHEGNENMLNCRKTKMEVGEVLKNMNEHFRKTDEMAPPIEDQSSRTSVRPNSGWISTPERSETKNNLKYRPEKESESNANLEIKMKTIQVLKNTSKHFQKREAIAMSVDTSMMKLQKCDPKEKVTCEKAVNTDAALRDNENVTAEWELEVEIENVEDTTLIKTEEEEPREGGHDMKEISSMNLVFVCDDNLAVRQELTPLDFCEVEECILKDEKTKTTCKAVLPRNLINQLEKKLGGTAKD